MVALPLLSLIRRAVPFPAILLLAGACAVEMPQGVPVPDGLGGGLEDVVSVGFRTLSDSDAVNVEFYVASEPLSNLPGDLFVEANLVTANIGIAGTGIVLPRSSDTVDLPCSDTLTLGTRGGTFFDNESGEQRGVGDPRWAQASSLGLCGGIVVFTFSETANGFATDVSIGR